MNDIKTLRKEAAQRRKEFRDLIKPILTKEEKRINHINALFARAYEMDWDDWDRKEDAAGLVSQMGDGRMYWGNNCNECK